MDGTGARTSSEEGQFDIEERSMAQDAGGGRSLWFLFPFCPCRDSSPPFLGYEIAFLFISIFRSVIVNAPS